jgi:hypothetical protein
MKYVVKFGDKYSTGVPVKPGPNDVACLKFGMALGLTDDKAKAFVFDDADYGEGEGKYSLQPDAKTHAQRHVDVWTVDGLFDGVIEAIQ